MIRTRGGGCEKGTAVTDGLVEIDKERERERQRERERERQRERV